MSIILVTRKAEMDRIAVRGQPGQKVLEKPSQPMAGCGGMLVISANQEA
jgi:hypothetical protein